MRRLLLATVPVVIALLLQILQPSQPPSPSPSKSIQNHESKSARQQSKTSPYNGNTDLLVTAINELATKIAAWEIQSETTKENNHSPADWWMVGSSFISAFAALGILWLAHRQHQAMVGQRLAMDKQADYMRQALAHTGAQLEQIRSQTRPWVGLDRDRGGLQSTPLTIDKDGTVHAQCNILVRNFGNYPAQRVFAGIDLVVTQHMDAVTDREKYFTTMSAPGNLGTVVFPGPSGIVWHWPVRVTKEQAVRSEGGGNQFLAFAVGCISYLDQFGEHHYTVFTYRLQQPNSIAGVTFELIPNSTVTGQWVESSGFVDHPNRPTPSVPRQGEQAHE